MDIHSYDTVFLERIVVSNTTDLATSFCLLKKDDATLAWDHMLGGDPFGMFVWIPTYISAIFHGHPVQVTFWACWYSRHHGTCRFVANLSLDKSEWNHRADTIDGWMV
jgi:hypothetical protein